MARLRTASDIITAAFNDPAGRSTSAASAPYRTIDRRSSYGFNNTLIEAATQTQDRKAVTLVDYDIHRTISVIGRRTLMSLGRALFWRQPALQASILEQANLAVVPFNHLYGGGNKAWGEAATEYLENFHDSMDLAGWPYDYSSYGESLIVSNLVDGDQGTLLTEDMSGNPKIQVIPSHRIGSRYQTSGVALVRYEGNTLSIDGKIVDDSLPFTFAQPVEWEAQMIDGAIVDDQSRAIAYRVFSDPAVSINSQDISARNLFLAFLPMVSGQLRGYSLLASSVFDWQDFQEWKRFETMAQKAFSTKTIVEHNETGDVNTSEAVIAAPATFDASGNKTTPDMVKLDGGAYTYFKAGTQSKLEAFNWGSRPGRETQDFMSMTVRDAMRGTEWDSFFSLDPQGVGGAPMRVIVDRINRTLRKRRRLAEMNIRRVDTYALAKGIKNGDLAFDADWLKWTYRAQPDLTADRRYDAQTDEMEYGLGWSTMEDIESRRNGDWQSKRAQRETEVMDKYDRAKRIADKYKISIQEAAQEMGLTGTFGVSLARRDQGDNALETDSQGNPISPNPQKPKQPTQK